VQELPTSLLTSNFYLLTFMIYPVRAGAGESRPEHRETRCADDQREAFLPPGAVTAAEFDPPGGNREREADQDRERPATDQPEEHAAHATQCHREIA